MWQKRGHTDPENGIESLGYLLRRREERTVRYLVPETWTLN